MEDGKRYTPDMPDDQNRKEYEDQAEELLKQSNKETQGDYGQQYGYDPRYSQGTGNAGYDQQYGYDSRYAQGGGYDQQQYGYDKNYGQQQYGYDPRYAQGGGYDQQQYGYDKNYGQQRYGYDSRYSQSGSSGGYDQQQYGYDKNYGQQQYGYDPNNNQQYGYEKNYGRQQYGSQYYAQQDEKQYGRKQEEEEQPEEYSRRRRGTMGDRIHETHDSDFEEEFNENEDLLGDYDEDDDEDERPSRRRRESSEKGGLKEKLSGIPSKTLLLIGGGIVAVLLILIIVVATSSNTESQPVEVAATETPIPTETPVPTEEPTPAPTETPHPITTPLNFGMQADIVADIQQRLIDLGYMDYPVVDGVQQTTTMYGKTTKNAIRTFQSKNGLDTDGQCGQSTYDLLMSDAAKGYFVSRGDEDNGEDGPVRKMQNRLIELGFMKGPATGHCGETTVLAVQKFQQANGLDPDAKAGQQTLKLMYSDDAIGKDGTKVPYTAPVVTTETAAAATPTPTPEPTDELAEEDTEEDA